MAFLVDSNVLVYSVDGRYPEKQDVAVRLLETGLAAGEVRLAHQSVVEFVRATTREKRREPPILPMAEATRIAEEYLTVFPVLYPEEAIVRLALRGAAAYQIPWYDAHMWAYAEFHGFPRLYSEDFQPGRTYGRVLVVDPFR